MKSQRLKLRDLNMSVLLVLFSGLPLAAASPVTSTTYLSLTVQEVCLVSAAPPQQVQLKCTRNSAAPQDPRAMSGVPDELRLAGPLVVVAEGQSPDGAALYTYATAQGAVGSADGLWSVEYY